MALRENDLEQRLLNNLESLCTIHTDEDLDHRYKIDFVITRFKDIKKFPEQIGVQLTARLGDVGKQRIFLDVSRRYPEMIPRRVYLELDAQADSVSAAAVAYVALVAFVFDRKHDDVPLTGIRIQRDLTYEFFDLEQNIATLTAMPPATASVKGPDALEGTLTTFRTGGFGFIDTLQPRNRFYFHVLGSRPPQEFAEWLQATLAASGGTNLTLSISVAFRDGGERRPGQAHLAVDVQPLGEWRPAVP